MIWNTSSINNILFGWFLFLQLGDEDNGEQGSWFVLSALGLYVTTPGHINSIHIAYYIAYYIAYIYIVYSIYILSYYFIICMYVCMYVYLYVFKTCLYMWIFFTTQVLQIMCWGRRYLNMWLSIEAVKVPPSLSPCFTYFLSEPMKRKWRWDIRTCMERRSKIRPFQIIS